MAISEPKSAHLREVLLFAFNWKKGATEAHRMLEEVYSDHALSESQCYRWFKNSKVAILNLIMNHMENCPKSSRTLNCKLCWMRTVPKCRRNSQNSSRHEKKSFLHRIVTSDEKWIHFSNPTRQRSWGLPGQFPKQTPRPNRFGKKAMLCIWWDQTGVVYFELLKPGKMVNTSCYEQQMHSLREALNEKRPEWREKHNNLILQHDNAPAHNATTELISSKGYNVSDHEVVTADGYVLTIQRILPRRKLPGPPKVALLQHGLLGASHDWVLNSPNQSLDLKLAEFPLKMIFVKDAQKFQRTDENDRNQIKKTPAKFIPRFFTNEQKLCRLATCKDMLEMTRTDPEWKDKIITGYETWVYGYDPETKHQSAEWRCQGEIRPEKSRLLKSRNKVLLVAFLDKRGIFHHEYLPAGQTVIKDMYLGILRRLREAIRKKRPEKWTNGGWILHHDNARLHTAHLMTSFLAKNGTQILLQPPYFPDIAPNDFFLFPKLKAVLKGRHFDTRDDIIEKSPLALKSIPKEAYKNCFDNWEKRWRLCVEARGDYFEKF
ncbi:hypothetical protein LAZ67_11000943 [Cordylochernes scorpioides]|uniref:Transposase n=1 Tax=Cordylochernes scorpioides TaxID=51811 RepID=A0ABY6L308_9ARAC|nr:hypothetical protein LAZ67_11000943 [Cordylochernes scorpioides]